MKNKQVISEILLAKHRSAVPSDIFKTKSYKRIRTEQFESQMGILTTRLPSFVGWPSQLLYLSRTHSSRKMCRRIFEYSGNWRNSVLQVHVYVRNGLFENYFYNIFCEWIQVFCISLLFRSKSCAGRKTLNVIKFSCPTPFKGALRPKPNPPSNSPKSCLW